MFIHSVMQIMENNCDLHNYFPLLSLLFYSSFICHASVCNLWLKKHKNTRTLHTAYFKWPLQRRLDPGHTHTHKQDLWQPGGERGWVGPAGRGVAGGTTAHPHTQPRDMRCCGPETPESPHHIPERHPCPVDIICD